MPFSSSTVCTIYAVKMRRGSDRRFQMMTKANDVIRQEDPQAVEKARKKLADREEKHEAMKAVNA